MSRTAGPCCRPPVRVSDRRFLLSFFVSRSLSLPSLSTCLSLSKNLRSTSPPPLVVSPMTEQTRGGGGDKDGHRFVDKGMAG
ncbi:hypothetical protein Hanom_Chr17g01587881 [Helianthus anomalus]